MHHTSRTTVGLIATCLTALLAGCPDGEGDNNDMDMAVVPPGGPSRAAMPSPLGDPTKPARPVPGGNNAQAVQWGGLRHLLGGATSLVGSGSAKGVLRNLDTANQEGLAEGTVDFDTFPLGDSAGKMIPAGCAYP